MRKEVSLVQIDVNKRNALNSTGPQTLQGKEKAKINALKHGIFANEVVNRGSGESIRMFYKLLTTLAEDLCPVGALESILVERIATTLWRLRRVYRAENMATNNPKTSKQQAQISQYEVLLPGPADASLALTDPVTSVMNRNEMLEEISRLRINLQSVNKALSERCESTPKKTNLKPALPSGAEVDKILKYESALERQLSKAVDQLLHLQSRRRGEPVPPTLNVHIENTDS